MAACPKCGSIIEERAAFCGDCGYRFAVEGTDAGADPLLGTVVDGRYRVLDLIGRGGMGAVYRVEHVKMGKIMAMKLLHSELSHDSDVTRRFRREAQAVSKLSHANNVSVFDFGTHNGAMYLVMEYIAGIDLAEHLRQNGVMPPSRMIAVMMQVCLGLMDAHSKGIIHRDLKPENIILSTSADGSDLVKVVDFGLAQLRDGPGRTKITQQGSLVGTPYYMAPEHIRGERVDERSDIYALGAVMFKLLTGDPPFLAPTPMGVITRHLTEEVTAPSLRLPEAGIAPEVDALVLKAMSKDPARRFGSAKELRRALEQLGAALDPSSFARRHAASDWQIGEGATAARSEWAMGGGETPVVTRFPIVQAEAEPARRPSTITIGAREMVIGTKKDVVEFERSIRRRRLFWILAGVALLLAAACAVLYLLLVHGKDDSNPLAETEPNDSPAKADTLTPGVQLAGFIDSADLQGDIDWYRIDGPARGEWALEVQVTGVPTADLALQLVDPGSSRARLTVDETGPGEAESVFPSVLDIPRVFLMVQEVRRPGVPPGRFLGMPYGVTYWMFDPASVEREPNDTASTATAAFAGTAVRARLDGSKDRDWYCLPAGRAASSVRVSAIAGVDVTVGIVAGVGSKEVEVNNAPAGQAEIVSIGPAAGPVCVVVAQAAARANTTGAGGGPYEIHFQ